MVLPMQKTLLTRSVLLLIFIAGLWTAYTQGPRPAKIDVVKVKEDLYVLHNPAAPGNVTALITTEGVILIDDKFEIDQDRKSVV